MSDDAERGLVRFEEPLAGVDAPRERALAAALERRLRDLDRTQHECDALRAELAVRDGYVADLQRRLIEATESLAAAERELNRLRAEDAERTFEHYVRASADEAAIRRRIEEAVTLVALLRDRDRVAALQALRSMLRG
ncbi:MAG: hypothetical protein JO036_20455 [Candidatus Eremiobacteraeota bacterium]|nr:hypothetical protein [Candidatus Eremiobacteraeota bacterium]